MRILWVDDEIEGLRPHILFLEREGIKVVPFDRPEDALEALKVSSFDLVILDYRMPSMDGLTTLREVRKLAPHVPVALVTMVTDREIIEESVAEDVFDYIVKPVQPSQVLALIKRLEAEKIKSRFKGRKMAQAYAELNRLPMDYHGWLQRARLLAELRYQEGLEAWADEMRAENQEFARWVERQYREVLFDPKLTWSHNLLKKHLLPVLREKKTALFIFDNFRLDQFVALSHRLPSPARMEQVLYMALLPTATPFARNALYAGLLPYDIERRHPGWTLDNRHERELLEEFLQEHGLGHLSHVVHKINSLKAFQEIPVGREPFEVFSVNFIDLLSHLRLEVPSLKDLTPDEGAFMRWADYVLQEARFLQKVERLLDQGYTVFLTTDHGWVEGRDALVVHGGGELTPGLRFKFGDSVRVSDRGGILWTHLKEYGLPTNRGSRLLLATVYHYLVYPSDVRRFEKTYRGGIYHGGVSLEEMCLPLLKLER